MSFGWGVDWWEKTFSHFNFIRLFIEYVSEAAVLKEEQLHACTTALSPTGISVTARDLQGGWGGGGFRHFQKALKKPLL